MRRYWIEKKSILNDQVFFDGETFHHIFDVCRQVEGSRFEVLTEDSEAKLVEVLKKEKKSAIAKVISTRSIPTLPKPHIHLVMSICRYPVMDAVIEKAVELGVSTIKTFTSDFSFIKKNDSLPQAKLERWKKIIISATQQSGRGDLMSIESPKTFETILENFNQNTSTLGLFAYEGDSILNLQDFLANLNSTKSNTQLNIENIWIFVGSEGGFSQPEVSHLERAGLKAITLGTQILRVETACVTLVSVLKYAFNLWK